MFSAALWAAAALLNQKLSKYRYSLVMYWWFVLTALHGAISAAEIADTVSHGHDLDVMARDLVTSANQQDGSDNISLQVIRIRRVERTGMYRGRPYTFR